VVDSVTGFGESQPAASNATAEGMARNRRVEVLCKKG
jgi:flagellar motor protein MotB